MKVKNNAVSPVIIGDSNPSILSADFRVRECGLIFDGRAVDEERVPVVSRVEYLRGLVSGGP